MTYLKQLIYLTYIDRSGSTSAIYGTRLQSQIYLTIQVLQIRILRLSTDARVCQKLTAIHRGIKLPFVKDPLHKTYSQHNSTLTVHPNPFIRHIPLNMPPATQHRLLKRKRHPDNLTQDWQHNGGCPPPAQVSHCDTWKLQFIIII